MGNLPSGTVTFLFTDIEGSTKLAQSLGDRWETLRARHHEILKSAIEANNGYVFQIIGDAFCATFHNANDALKAAIKSQTELNKEVWEDIPIKVRMGINTGKAEFQEEGQYHGYLAMSRVQRVMSVAYGGQVLLSDASAVLVRGELPEGITLLDLKEHRLKGLLLPEHLWQVVIPDLPRDFPPLASLNVIPNNLPTQLTSFVGREKAIEEVKGELGNHRLVTLTGSGGTGKTRLSLQVAAEVLDQFEQGVWFIELAPLSDPDLIPQTIQNAMGLVEQKGISILQALQEYLQDKKVLLVLDNCEHLIEACANVANELLSRSTNLKILASSREALSVQGEVAWHVPSLSLPDTKNIPAPEELSQYEAVRLFIERASLVNPHFEVNKANAPAIAQVCFHLGGIPLAIELAAARIKVLSVEQINTRLDDRFRLLTGGARTALPRQQTLRALIDWSYNLLNEKEKLLFRRLAVFVGGWSLEAAESVCSDEQIDTYEVLDLMSSLVDKSLLNTEEFQGEVRYSRLETIRQYTREKFFDTNEVEILRDRHLQYYVELAERAEPETRSHNQVIWLDRLEMELDNIRSAMEWAQERNAESFLRLASGAWRFWDVRGYLDEGTGWLSKALNATESLEAKTRSTAMARMAHLVANYEALERAGTFAKAALELAEVVNDKFAEARALSLLSQLEEVQSYYDEGIEHNDQALAIAQEIDDHWLKAIIFFARPLRPVDDKALAVGQATVEEGIREARQSGDKRLICFGLRLLIFFPMVTNNSRHAHKSLQEALSLAEEINDRANIVRCYCDMSRLEVMEEDYESAEENANIALKLAKSINDQTGMISPLMCLARTYRATERIQPLFEISQECINFARKNNSSINIIHALLYSAFALLEKGDRTNARTNAKEALKIAMEYNFNIGLRRSFWACAAIARSEKKYKKCAYLLAISTNMTLKYLWMPFPYRERLFERYIAESREYLGEEAFNQAWEAGQAMTVEEAIEYASEETSE